MGIALLVSLMVFEAKFRTFSDERRPEVEPLQFQSGVPSQLMNTFGMAVLVLTEKSLLRCTWKKAYNIVKKVGFVRRFLE